MKSILKTVAAAALVLSSWTAAHAATFNFSFSGSDGAVAGTVAGFFVLPDGDSTYGITDLSSFVISSAPAALNYPLPFDFFAQGAPVVEGTNPPSSITVAGGNVTAISLTMFVNTNPDSAVGLNGSFGSSLGGYATSNYLTNGVRDADSSSLVITAVNPVPLPAPALLLAIGLGAIGVLRVRRG